MALVYISLIFLLSAVGIGYGVWQEGAKVNTLISTGKIDPIISSYEIESTDNPPSEVLTTVQISEDKKSMGILIDGATPGYKVGIKYTITNQGTIPVHCKLSTQTTGSTESAGINISQPEAVIDGYGGTSDGTVNIIVYSLKDLENCEFTAGLQFKQYNEVFTE